MDSITRIVDIELKGLLARTAANGYTLEVDDSAKRFLATKGYDVQFGARPLRRAIQNYLEDSLSELIVSGQVAPGDTLLVAAGQDALDIRRKEPQEAEN